MKLRTKTFIILFFVFLFIFGISNVTGYGRPIDEPAEQKILLMNIKEYLELIGVEPTHSIFQGIPHISQSIELDHGIAAYYLFTPILNWIREDSLTTMLVWHINTYLIWFCGVVALYFILVDVFHHRWTHFTGVLIYYFTPRMYAESHYNNKDIVFLSLVIIMLSFAIRALKRWKTSDIIGFVISSGFLMNCKVVGIAIWGLTGLFSIGYAIYNKNRYDFDNSLRCLFIAAVFSFTMFFALTPAMWRSPIGYIQYCLSNATGFSRWDQTFLFHGNIVKPSVDGVPRTYLIQWILLTTPIYIIFLFASSVVIYSFYIRSFLKKSITIGDDHLDLSKSQLNNREAFYLLFIITFVFPIAISVIKAPTLVLYNGWRHNYYLYAYIILCSCYSIDWLLDRISERVLYRVACGIIAVCFVFTVTDMMLHRSFEYMYFNPIARAAVDVEGFEGDYWNVSVLPAMKEFAQGKEEVNIAAVGYAASGQMKDLTMDNLKIVNVDADPDFYLFNTWMMQDKTELANYEKVYSFQEYGHELCGIFVKKSDVS